MRLAFAERARNKIIRTASHLLHRRPLRIVRGVPLISFTFDDFPRSALLNAGAILKRHRLRATYYTAFGLMGQHSAVGDMFLHEDVKTVLKDGHELGCHTYAHDNASRTMAAAFDASIRNNRRVLDQLFPGVTFRSLSYPYSIPRPSVKATAGRHFDCCRSGGQTYNVGIADLNGLASFFLEQANGRPQVVKDIIDETCRTGGWLILDTHDVCATPSRFGCTTAFFEEVVEYADRSDARILPVIDALQALKARAGTSATAIDGPSWAR